MNTMESMRVDVPDGQSGPWKVETFTVSKQDSDFSLIRGFRDGRYVRPGTYKRLQRAGQSGPMMSDTHDELRDHSGIVRCAHGTCLVNGLGLGCVVQGMLEKKKDDGSFAVDKVYVVEKEEDVIKLVAPHYEAKYGDRLEIIHADAFEYKPPRGMYYNVVWHDIWLSICEDNWEQMTKLHRKYGRRCDHQDSWSRSRLKAIRKQRQRRPRGFWGW